MANSTYKIIIENKNGNLTASNSEWLGDVYTQYKAIRRLAPVAMVTGISKNLINWRISRVGRDMGSSLTQQKIDIGMSIAEQTLSAGSVIVGGIATANPALIVAGVASGINTVIGYAKEKEQYNYNRSWENKALVYARERAGASFNRSREE